LVPYGILGAPRARIVRESIREYFLLVSSASPNLISDIRVAWPIARDGLKANPVIGDVRGLIPNIIKIFRRARWNPRQYNLWEDPHGGLWAITGRKVSPNIVAAAITRSYLDLDLIRAATHYNGKGIMNGVDYDSMLRVVRALKDSKDTSYQFKCPLESIIAGTSWPAARIHEHRILYPILFPCCGIEPETDLHRYWSCP